MKSHQGNLGVRLTMSDLHGLRYYSGCCSMQNERARRERLGVGTEEVIAIIHARNDDNLD